MVLAAGRAEVANDTDQADEAQASSSRARRRYPDHRVGSARRCGPVGAPVPGLEARFRVSLVRGCRAAAAGSQNQPLRAAARREALPVRHPPSAGPSWATSRWPTLTIFHAVSTFGTIPDTRAPTVTHGHSRPRRSQAGRGRSTWSGPWWRPRRNRTSRSMPKRSMPPSGSPVIRTRMRRILQTSPVPTRRDDGRHRP